MSTAPTFFSLPPHPHTGEPIASHPRENFSNPKGQEDKRLSNLTPLFSHAATCRSVRLASLDWVRRRAFKPVHLQSCQSSMYAILSVQPPTFRLRFSSMIFGAFRIRSFLGRRCSGCAF